MDEPKYLSQFEKKNLKRKFDFNGTYRQTIQVSFKTYFKCYSYKERNAFIATIKSTVIRQEFGTWHTGRKFENSI